MRALKTNKVFFSADSMNRDADRNEVAFQACRLALQKAIGTGFGVLQGRYQGFNEQTFLLESTDYGIHEDNVALALELADQFSQESILVVDNEDVATIVTVSGRESVVIGRFTEVSEDEAKRESAYTFDPLSGRYFVVKARK